MVGVVGIIIKINSFFFQKPPGYETVSAMIALPRVRLPGCSLVPRLSRPMAKNSLVTWANIPGAVTLHRVFIT